MMAKGPHSCLSCCEIMPSFACPYGQSQLPKSLLQVQQSAEAKWACHADDTFCHDKVEGCEWSNEHEQMVTAASDTTIHAMHSAFFAVTSITSHVC